MSTALQEGPAAPACPVKILVFTVNLLIGLSVSQAVPGWLAPDAYHTWQQIVKLCTMFCLSYIMINVGYEFDIDKTTLRKYGSDYGIAMTAAGFPWIFVAFWFVYALPDPLPWKEALVAARFAAPTSAGILFSMLEAAGMKETWLFQKARILAIFDDLDTILLMVPLKVIIVGLKWELTIDLFFVVVLLGVSWHWLHAKKIPVSSAATLFYAAIVTCVCESVHVITHYHIEDMDTVHLEVLLPAFAIGCIARSGHSETRHSHSAEQLQASRSFSDVEKEREREGVDATPSLMSTRSLQSCTGGTSDRNGVDVVVSEDCEDGTEDVRVAPKEPQHQDSKPPIGPRPRRVLSRKTSLLVEDAWLAGTRNLATMISAIFMVLVGLSMPALFGGGSEEEGHRRLGAGGKSGGGSDEEMPAGALIGHVVVVTVLMIIGKMFPTICYRDEANLRTRFALSLGMCPRGEVGAGVIVISLGFGIEGSAITIAVIALAINLILSSGFIMAVKHLARETNTPVLPFMSDAAGKPSTIGEQDQMNSRGTTTPVNLLDRDGPQAVSGENSKEVNPEKAFDAWE
mmetsp:Transcript_148927/g.387267  ORF Transcript_148927/g.387267 Transcript_148927/m.387267 type:complete len:571 (-) Transcript_148927:389-2101(-)